MFAYHAGMLDSGDPSGRIIHDKRGAYALYLTGNDEIDSTGPHRFVYKSRQGDNGRYRLTAARPQSRQPVRILRSHTLRCFWAPSAGIRYDGLYKVVGWRLSHDIKTRTWSYDIEFQRLLSEPPMAEVLRRPTAEEVDDYKEYKRIRETIRLVQNPFHRARPLLDSDRETISTVATFQTVDSYIDSKVEPADTRPVMRIDIPKPVFNLAASSLNPATPGSGGMAPGSLFGEHRAVFHDPRALHMVPAPMSVSVNEALETIRKQSLDAIAPFSWQ